MFETGDVWGLGGVGDWVGVGDWGGVSEGGGKFIKEIPLKINRNK